MEEQNLNQGTRLDNKSGYVGVFFHKHAKRWCLKIKFKRKVIYNGLFETIKEAVAYRKDFIIRNNLPHKIQQYKEAQDER
jgi:hypothetical protein